MREVIVAGGSGGLGSEAVRVLSKDFRVVFSYKANSARAGAVGAGEAVQADLLQASDRVRLLDAVSELYGLAIFTGEPARGSDEAVYRRSHEINFLAPVLLAREAAERMKSLGVPGAIVLISTMQAAALFAGSTAYAAQKAALLHAGRILAKECRGAANIRVNVICPGVNQAGMAEASIASGKYDKYLEDGSIPRFGRAEDVARAVRFLMEPDSYITGQVLTIDGGLTL
ncbi:MAG: SDR family oxidoreductase [Bryobacteraceae bacterium]|nr:SDR family oxidoreductase [Bryobacteraceae bacterium]